MMKAILCFSLILTGPLAFAEKAPKISEKAVLEVEKCRHCVNRSVMAACSRYTGTYENEALCNRIESNPHVTEGCSRYTSSYQNERLCLEQQIPAFVSRGCKKYSSTYQNEALCMSLRVSPRNAETCYRYTGTYQGETDCLKKCAGSADHD